MDVKDTPIIEGCPSCGRPMSVGLQLIGQPISCGHCGCDVRVQIDRASVMDRVVAMRGQGSQSR